MTKKIQTFTNILLRLAILLLNVITKLSVHEFQWNLTDKVLEHFYEQRLLVLVN